MHSRLIRQAAILAGALLALSACADMGWNNTRTDRTGSAQSGTATGSSGAGTSGTSGSTVDAPGAGTTTGNDAISRNRAPSSSRQPGGATSGEYWRPMDSDAPGAN